MRLEEFLETFDRRVEYIRQFNIPESVEIYFRCMRRYYQDVMEAKKEGKPLAWISIMAPMEIFRAMDIVPFAVDPYAITVTAFAYFKKEDCPFFDIGDSYGYPSDACSPHRVAVGLAATNTLPEPDLIFYTTPMPCDSAVALFDVLSDMKRVPTYIANYEYRYHPKSAEYLREEFISLIEFLEKTTGQRLDMEKLREVVELSRAANNAMIEIHQLRKKVPCPLRTRDAFNSFGMRIAGDGLVDSVRFFETQLREVQERVERKEGVVPDEKYRLVANGGYPFYVMDLLDWFQEEFGAIFVADFFNLTAWKKLEKADDLLEFMARKSLYFFGLETLYGPVENTIDKISEDILEAQVDGSFYFTHFGCKQGCGLQKIYRDKIMEKLGIPTLVVDMDISDPKVVSVEQMKNKIYEYMKMLENQKYGNG